LGQIRAWSDNPRLSTKAQAQRIIASERRFGQPLPFLVGPPEGGAYPLLDGHQRLAAWLTVYGPDYEMAARQASRPLTDAEHRELVVTLHSGATGSWDWQALSGWNAAELQGWGLDAAALADWNNDALNLRTMLTQAIDDASAFGALPDSDRPPFQQMTFTLHDTQAETVRRAIGISKALGAFDQSENENSNGNALARICETFITEHDNG
jgi:hypothetical protein